MGAGQSQGYIIEGAAGLLVPTTERSIAHGMTAPLLLLTNQSDHDIFVGFATGVAALPATYLVTGSTGASACVARNETVVVKREGATLFAISDTGSNRLLIRGAIPIGA